jgi:hypothetical protein
MKHLSQLLEDTESCKKIMTFFGNRWQFEDAIVYDNHTISLYGHNGDEDVSVNLQFNGIIWFEKNQDEHSMVFDSFAAVDLIRSLGYNNK